jgi:hypothetical protein
MRGEQCRGALRGIERVGVLDAVVWDGAPGHHDARVGRIGVPTVIVADGGQILGIWTDAWDMALP